MSGYKYYDDDYVITGNKFGKIVSDNCSTEVVKKNSVRSNIKPNDGGFIVFKNNDDGVLQQFSIVLSSYEEAENFIKSSFVEGLVIMKGVV